MSFAAAMLIALLVDAAVGWPKPVFDRIGHPVTWIGRVIGSVDTRWNMASLPEKWRRRRGVAASLVVIGCAILPAWLVQFWLPGGWAGAVLTGIIAWPLVAARSLHDHVTAVARPLAAGDLPGARLTVSMIVGRDPQRLDGAGIARAALESLAENTSDGVTAPLFWGAIAGLPGIAAYKAINTLDSMIGHRTMRYEDFGKAAARLDDLVNLVPARLTALAFALVSAAPLGAARVAAADARAHRSPNAGWPEAAMAGGLGVRLSGPRVYADLIAEEPWINGAAPDPDARAIDRGLALYRRAMISCWAALVAIALR
jgi:adenosylcobinamide-phosphate synthase